MWKKAELNKIAGKSKSSNDLLINNINETVAQIKEDLGDSSDLIVRLIKHKNNPFAFAVIHIDGISNTQNINEHIIEPLLAYKSDLHSAELKDELEQS